MKIVRSMQDLAPFGIECLTGEACGLGFRILFDLTAQGKRAFERCFDIKLTSEPWNGGSKDDPHVASIMLSREMMTTVGIFALLESGCTEVWQDADALFGIEPDDLPEYLERVRKGHPNLRRYAYFGTAGSRNRHEFTGRTT